MKVTDSARAAVKEYLDGEHRHQSIEDARDEADQEARYRDSFETIEHDHRLEQEEIWESVDRRAREEGLAPIQWRDAIIEAGYTNHCRIEEVYRLRQEDAFFPDLMFADYDGFGTHC